MNTIARVENGYYEIEVKKDLDGTLSFSVSCARLLLTEVEDTENWIESIRYTILDGEVIDSKTELVHPMLTLPPKDWIAPDVELVKDANGRTALFVDGQQKLQNLEGFGVAGGAVPCDHCGSPVTAHEQRAVGIQVQSVGAGRVNSIRYFAMCSAECRDDFMASGADEDLLEYSEDHSRSECLLPIDEKLAVLVAHRDGPGAFVPQVLHGFEKSDAIGTWWRTPVADDDLLEAPPRSISLLPINVRMN